MLCISSATEINASKTEIQQYKQGKKIRVKQN